MLKRLRKRLISSFIMCMVALMSVISSTFAWFSLNSQVEVTGMAIEVVNNNGYLIIGTKAKIAEATEPDVASLRAANLTTIDLSSQYTNVKCKPVAHQAVSKISEIDAMSDAKYTNWFTKTADSPTASTSTKDAVSISSYDGYVLFYDLYLTVADGSDELLNLKCNATIQATEDGQNVRNAARVLVASATKCEEFYNDHVEAGTDVSAHTTGEVVFADSIKNTDTSPIHIKVYVYVDGEDSSVYTNNALNLKTTTVSLIFVADTNVD